MSSSSNAAQVSAVVPYLPPTAFIDAMKAHVDAQAVPSSGGRILPVYDASKVSKGRARRVALPDNHEHFPRVFERPVVKVISPRGLPDIARARIAIHIMLGHRTTLTHEGSMLSFVLSPLNLILAGAGVHLAHGCDAEEVELTQEQVAYWTQATKHDQPPAGAEIVSHPGMRRVDIPAEAGRLTAAALYGMLAYCIAKTPNGLNDVAFTERRPRAAGAAIGQEGFPPDLVPDVERFIYAGGAFTISSSVRQAVARHLVGLCLRKVSPVEGALVGNVRLWRGHGLGSVEMVRTLIVDWGDVILGTRGLTAQLAYALEHMDAVAAKKDDPYLEYLNAIEGPLSPVHATGDYGTLMQLARDFMALHDERFGQYGVATSQAMLNAVKAAAARAGEALPEQLGDRAKNVLKANQGLLQSAASRRAARIAAAAARQ